MTAPLRATAAAEGLLGASLALRPRRASRLAGAPHDSLTRRVARLLGVRMLVQGAFTWAWPCRDVALAGAGVDCLHAATMLAAASVSRKHREAALTSAGIALLFATATTLAGRSRA